MKELEQCAATVRVDRKKFHCEDIAGHYKISHMGKQASSLHFANPWQQNYQIRWWEPTSEQVERDRPWR